MRKKNSLLLRNRGIWLISQFFILFACAAYIHNVYITNILPDKEANEYYQKTQCFLISKKLATKGHLIQRFRADFLISFNANGAQYNRWISGNGLDRSFGKNESEQEDLLSQFEIGGTYPCWYNPDSPQKVMLIARRTWFSTYPLIVPAALSLIVFYYFLKTLFQLIDGSIIKSRKKRQS